MRGRRGCDGGGGGRGKALNKPKDVRPSRQAEIRSETRSENIIMLQAEDEFITKGFFFFRVFFRVLFLEQMT